MLRHILFASTMTLCVHGAMAATSITTDLYGKQCRIVERDANGGPLTRRCPGVAGYSLLVHEANARSSVDIVTPDQRVYPLEYWEVVTAGPSWVGRKAEWRMERRGARRVPTGLLVRLDARSPVSEGPRIAPGAILTAARISDDGACVVYTGNAALKRADAQARAAASDRRRKCLGLPSP